MSWLWESYAPPTRSPLPRQPAARAPQRLRAEDEFFHSGVERVWHLDVRELAGTGNLNQAAAGVAACIACASLGRVSSSAPPTIISAGTSITTKSGVESECAEIVRSA